MQRFATLIRRLWANSTSRSANGRRRRQVLPRLELLESRLTPALSAVGNTTAYPLSAVVDLEATFPDGKQFHSTGAMIDRFHVLTAGHVVYHYYDGGFATSVIARPGLNGTS